MVTILSLQPGPPSSTGLGGPPPQKAAEVAHGGTSGSSLTSTCVPPPFTLPHPHCSCILTLFWTLLAHLPPSPCSSPLATRHSNVLPKLGADHASALKLYGTEDPSGNRKAVYTIPRKRHTPHNWYAVGCGAQGAHDPGPRHLHRGVRLPSTEDATTAP